MERARVKPAGSLPCYASRSLRSLLCAFAFTIATFVFASDPKPDADRATVIVAVGAAGEEQYGKVFQESAASWKKAAETAGANVTIVGLTPADGTNGLSELRSLLEKVLSPPEQKQLVD